MLLSKPRVEPLDPGPLSGIRSDQDPGQHCLPQTLGLPPDVLSDRELTPKFSGSIPIHCGRSSLGCHRSRATTTAGERKRALTLHFWHSVPTCKRYIDFLHAGLGNFHRSGRHIFAQHDIQYNTPLHEAGSPIELILGGDHSEHKQVSPIGRPGAVSPQSS